jgi:WD40 repeat protein
MLHPDFVMSVAFGPDGKTVATGCRDKAARLWDAATGVTIGRAMEHTQPVVALAFSPDGTTLLAGCADDFWTSGEARLWDAATGEPVAPPLVFAHGIGTVAFRPDGQAAAVGGGHPSLNGPGRGNVAIWAPPSVASGSAERLRLMAQIWTGLELRDSDGFGSLAPEIWQQRKQTLDGAAPVSDGARTEE